MITFAEGRDPLSRIRESGWRDKASDEIDAAWDEFLEHPERDLPEGYSDSFALLLKQIEEVSGLSGQVMELSCPIGGCPFYERSELEKHLCQVEVWHARGWVDCRGDIPKQVIEVLEHHARELLDAAKRIRSEFAEASSTDKEATTSAH